MPSARSSTNEQGSGFARYAWDRGKRVPLLLIVVTSALGLVLWIIQTSPLAALIDGVGIVAGFMTLGAVWFFDTRRAWIESIDTRATITYWYWGGNQWVRWKSMRDVFLSGEGDIRAWSQTLGGQLKKGKNFLPLEAYVHVADLNPAPTKLSDGGWVRRYNVHTPLWMDPDKYTPDTEYDSALYREVPKGSGRWERSPKCFTSLLEAITAAETADD